MLEIIIGVLVIIVSIAVIIAVLFQKGQRAGINGAISGAADTFLSKDNARTADKILAKYTKILAAVFFLLVIAANAVGILA